MKKNRHNFKARSQASIQCTPDQRLILLIKILKLPSTVRFKNWKSTNKKKLLAAHQNQYTVMMNSMYGTEVESFVSMILWLISKKKPEFQKG